MSTDTPTSHRPITSKPRGVCRYYNVPRGCFAGDNCKFLHGEPSQVQPELPPLLTPYDQAKQCRYFINGFCRRGDKCWFQHVFDSKDKGKAVEVVEEEQEEEICSICFEKPVTFGLLGGCSHVFCIACIKQWRDPNGKGGDMVESGNTKKCPMCRTPSKFITPSSQFFKQDDADKSKAIQAYKESMARVPCRYFQQSRQKNKNKPMCPFGKDCFYQHLNEDGTPYIFKDGVDICMRQHRARRSAEDPMRFPFFPFSLDSIPAFGGGIGGFDIVIDNEFTNITPWQTHEREGATGGAREEAATALERTETATRRLRDVSRSLEVLNNAIFDGASAESLNTAVEALRRGMSRLDAVRAGMGQPAGAGEYMPRRRRRPDIVVPGTWGANGVFEDEDGNEWAPDEDDHDIAVGHDTDPMYQLETLADQMLASLEFLRATTGEEADRTATPPPPLEPSVTHPHTAESSFPTSRSTRSTSHDSTSPPPLISTTDFMRQFNDGGSLDGVDDDVDMPDLQSVSNSSDSEDQSDSSEDEDEDVAGSDRDESGDDDAQLRVFPRAFDLGYEGPSDVHVERTMETLGRAWPLFQFLATASGPPGNPNTHTSGTNTAQTVWPDTGRTDEGSRARVITNVEESDSDEEMPGLEPVADGEDRDEDDEDEMPTLEPIGPSSSHSNPPAPSEPPFVTDGRGRVVWSSPASPIPPSDTESPPRPKTNHREISAAREFTTDGRGRVISVSNSGGSEDAESATEPSEPSTTEPSTRSFIGRMFGAFF